MEACPPRERRRSRLALTLEEREEISRSVAAGESARGIAARLGRAPSTITRELNRHGDRRGYRASEADRRAWERARRPQGCKLSRNAALREAVGAKLEEGWSPQQISGWLKISFPGDETLRVSHESIYLSLFVQARGALERELTVHLRRSRSIRRPRAAKRGDVGQGQIVDAVSIRERPPEAEDRAIPDHWEGGLLSGAGNSHIVTLVERHSRFVMLVGLDGKDTRTVIDALSREVRRLPEQLRRSLTASISSAVHRERPVALGKYWRCCADAGVACADNDDPARRSSSGRLDKPDRGLRPE